MTPKELLQSHKEETNQKRRVQQLNSYYKNRNIQPKELKDTKEANKKKSIQTKTGRQPAKASQYAEQRSYMKEKIQAVLEKPEDQRKCYG